MNIQLFNFLEDYNTQIVNLVTGKVKRAKPGYAEMSDDAVRTLVEHLLDGYIDLLVTGQTDSLDKLFRMVSRIVVARGAKYSDVFELPLVMGSVIRRLLAEEYSDLQAEDGISKFNAALEQSESTAQRAAGSFLDMFQKHVDERIDAHNEYLRKSEAEFGVNLSEFVIDPAAEG